MGQFMWQPEGSRINASKMRSFMAYVSRGGQHSIQDWESLYRWSIAEPADFWNLLSQFTKIRWKHQGARIYEPPAKGKMLGGRWFSDHTLNFAENLLPEPSDTTVITAITESGREEYSVRRLRNDVARLSEAMRKRGIGVGDRVAAVLPNGYHAIVAMLATTTIGAVFSSASPDFGAPAIVDRFAQIAPKMLFYASDYIYGGKRFDCRQVLLEVLKSLATVESAVMVGSGDLTHPRAVSFAVLLQTAQIEADGDGNIPIYFVEVPFSHPLYIMFSSGTTGAPKCIVHGTGGTLLQHLKELVLHSDISKGDRLLFFSTCGWMMWNWTTTALATGAALVTYDGSPLAPQGDQLWQIVSREGVTVFGTSPKFISASMKAGLNPSSLDLSCLKTILSTGSPLMEEQYEWVYAKVKANLHLSSISGGTDIISCFMLGNPLLPVRAGEIQGPGLGMAIEAWNDDGIRVDHEKGDLVCTQPFVSMPLGFLDDPADRKYRQAYFEAFPGREVWRHGDFVAFTEHGGVIVYGRSDATLNPGGVRIGTAEIYRQVEALSEVDDALTIGRTVGDDVEVILFVKLRAPLTIDRELETRIKVHLRHALSPRHVPRHILAVNAIPYTKSGKKVELAVTRIFAGEKPTGTSALVNPECLEEYHQLYAAMLLGGRLP